MTSARLETFADGVFAIVATLLILTVDGRIHDGALGGQLSHAWPSYLAYAVSAGFYVLERSLFGGRRVPDY